MDERTRDEGLGAADHARVAVRRPLWARIAKWIAIGLLVLLVVAIAFVWIERRPIATHFLKNEFEQRGVTAKYHLDKVGFRTQQVSNLVIGDPKHPDLVAKKAIVQMRLKLDGSFRVYRVVARGVRLRGRLVHGRVSWGQLDKLLPPPSNKPFALPDIVLDVADSSISLATPFGPVGIALQGNGRLSGGFKGHVAISSPRLALGHCEANDLSAYLAVAVVARHPQVEGPVSLSSFACPVSHFSAVAPRFDAKAKFNESFTNVDGTGRMAIGTLTAGTNGLAAFVGDISYRGSLTNISGQVKLAAQRSRMATVTAERTRLNADYRLGMQAGTFSLRGNFAVDNSTLDPKMLGSVTAPLASAAGTPIGPVATSISSAIGRVASRFNASGHIRVVNFPGGGAARITEDANAYKAKVIDTAKGDASRFTQILKAYQQAPAVTRERMYLESLEQVLSDSSKVLVDVEKGSNLLYLPLDKLMQRTPSDDGAPSASSPGDAGLPPVSSTQDDSRRAVRPSRTSRESR